MKKISGYWVDENNNRWDCDAYTKIEAIELSKTLIDCSNCIGCRDCIDCRNCHTCSTCIGCRDCIDCIDCRNCHTCSTCIDCHTCSNCIGCRDCIDCRNCSNCIGCRDCIDCRNCRYCHGCSGCHDFEYNPQNYTTPKIGRDNRNTTIYWIADNIQIVCGCFRGDLNKFEKAVKETHGNNEHGIAYKKQIKTMKYLIKQNGN